MRVTGPSVLPGRGHAPSEPCVCVRVGGLGGCVRVVVPGGLGHCFGPQNGSVSDEMGVCEGVGKGERGERDQANLSL